MPAFHFLEALPLFRIEERTHLLMRLSESCGDPLACFLANGLELSRGAINDRRNLRGLFRSQAQLTLHVGTHPLASPRAVPPHKDKVRMARTDKKPRGHTREEDDHQGDCQLPFPALHHGTVPASITVSAMA